MVGYKHTSIASGNTLPKYELELSIKLERQRGSKLMSFCDG